MIDRKEFEKIGAQESELRDAELQAQIGNPNFQSSQQTSTDLFCTNCRKQLEPNEDVTVVASAQVESFGLVYETFLSDSPYIHTLCRLCRNKLLSGTVHIEVKGGEVKDVGNLPPGWDYKVHDWDHCPDCGTLDPDCPLCRTERTGEPPVQGREKPGSFDRMDTAEIFGYDGEHWD